MALIDCAIPEDRYKLLIEFNNGNAVILDFESKLKTFRFNSLENIDNFKRVTTDGVSLMWNNGNLRVGINEIIQMTLEM